MKSPPMIKVFDGILIFKSNKVPASLKVGPAFHFIFFSARFARAKKGYRFNRGYVVVYFPARCAIKSIYAPIKVNKIINAIIDFILAKFIVQPKAGSLLGGNSRLSSGL